MHGLSERAKNIHSLSKYSTVVLMPSETRFSAKVAHQGRDQKAQHSNWLKGASKVFEITRPTGARDIHSKLILSLLAFSCLSVCPAAADAQAEL